MREERAIEVTREFLRRNERFGEVSELTGAKTASDGLRVRVDLIKGTYPYGARLKNELQECLKDELNYDNIDVVVSRVASPSSNAPFVLSTFLFLSLSSSSVSSCVCVCVILESETV